MNIDKQELRDLLIPCLTENDLHIIDHILEYLKTCDRCQEIYDTTEDGIWENLCRRCIVECKIESSIRVNPLEDDVFDLLVDEVYYLDIEDKERFEENLSKIISCFCEWTKLKNVEELIDIVKELSGIEIRTCHCCDNLSVRSA